MWKSQEKDRHRMAPRKNMPMATFSWTGATKDMLGLNMYMRPRQRKNRQPADRKASLFSPLRFRASESDRALTQQVGPDVPRLRVDSEDAPETGAEGRHGRAVAVEKEVVVLQPVGQHVVRDDPPPALPHLPDDSV